MDIKRVIKERGYTINSVADALGVNRVSFSQTLSNNPTIKTLRKIADVIGCNISDFFDDERADAEITALIDFRGKLYKATSVDELLRLLSELDIL